MPINEHKMEVMVRRRIRFSTSRISITRGYADVVLRDRSDQRLRTRGSESEDVHVSVVSAGHTADHDV